jgi:fermentation-respiration switch protein FrsA (DUF1100 family)
MGGAAAIMAAAQDQRIAAVATQGAYASLDRAVEQRGRWLLGFAGPLLTTPARMIAKRWLSFEPCDVSPAECIARLSPRPVILFHGKRDPFVKVDDAYMLFEMARDPKKLVVLSHSGHIDLAVDDAELFEEELSSFFRRNLLELQTAPETRSRSGQRESP